MKQLRTPFGISLALLSLLLLTAAASFAAGPGDSENAKKRYFGDGSVEFDTTDLFGNEVTVVIDPAINRPVNHAWDDPDNALFRGFEVDELDKYPGEAPSATTVPVYAAADEEYRAQYSNWTSKLYNIIETADNAYYRDYAINWVIQGYYNWTSSGSNSSAILSDLAYDFRNMSDGLVMGFTRDSKFTAGGIAYVYSSNPGTGYSVCLDQGSTSTVYALRHEIGHNYGASHDFGSTVCMMNYTYAYSVDYFDSAHDSLVSSHSNWF